MKKTLALGLACAAVSALCACAAPPAAGPVLVPGPVFSLVEESRIDIDGELLGRPLALGNDVVLSAAPNRVLAVSPAAKKILWQFTAKAALSAPAVVGSDFVVVFDQGGRMTRLSRDGKSVWEREVKGAISALPVLAKGGILAVFDRRTLRSFDPATGAEQWSWTAEDDIRSGPRSWGEKTIVLTAAKRAILVSPGGKTSPGFETTVAASGPFLVSGDRLFAGLENGTVEAWDLTKMKKRWTVKLGAALAADPVVDGPRILIVTESRQLFALDAKRGDAVWWQSLPGRSVGETAVCGTRLLAAALSSVLTSFDPATGKKGETIELKQEAIAAPLVLGGWVAVVVRGPVSLKTTLVVLAGKPLPPPPKKKT